MKVTKVKGIKCPHCDELIEETDIPQPVNRVIYQCGECQETYEDIDEAKECCKE